MSKWLERALGLGGGGGANSANSDKWAAVVSDARPIGANGAIGTDPPNPGAAVRGGRASLHLAGRVSPPFDWRDYFEERAAIREHDGGALRAEAERRAYSDCLRLWQARNPVAALGDNDKRCIHCGLESPDNALTLARTSAEPRPRWLHQDCQEQFQFVRASAAEVDLARGGVKCPPGFESGFK